MKSKDDQSSVEPEVFDRELDQGRPGSAKPLGKTIYPFSANPLLNAGRAYTLGGYTKVIAAENQLMGSLVVHEKLRGQLEDIGTEIETERLERRNRRADVAHQTKVQAQRHSVEELELEVHQEELRQRLKALRGERDDDEALEAKLARQNAEKALKRKYAIRRAMEEIEQTYLLKREKIGKLNQLIQEIRAGDLPDEEKEAQIQEIERLILAIEQGI